MNQTRMKSFDVLKGFACIAVILIHYNFIEPYGLYIKTFCRFAVPVFFIISGYFFFSNGKMDDAKVVNKIRHIVYMLLGSGLFYVFFAVFENKINNPNWDITKYIINKASAGKIVKLFVTNDPLVYSHLWYMLALVYCYVFSLFLFNKNKRIVLINILAPILLIIYSSMQEFGAVLGIRTSVPLPGTEVDIYLFNLFLLRALPFFLFGIIIRRYQEKLARIPLNIPAGIVIICTGGFIAILERLAFREAQFYIGTYIMTVSMIILAIKKPEAEIKILGYIGRELSMYMYIFHIAIGKTIDILARETDLRGTPFYTWARAFIILFFSLLFSQCVVSVKKKIGRA